MTKHEVICRDCGKTFDANGGGIYVAASQRYICPQCSEKYYAQARKKAAIKKGFKIFFGIIFALAGFSAPDGGWSIGYFLTAEVMGGALLLWAFWPTIKKVKAKQSES